MRRAVAVNDDGSARMAIGCIHALAARVAQGDAAAHMGIGGEASGW